MTPGLTGNREEPNVMTRVSIVQQAPEIDENFAQRVAGMGLVGGPCEPRIPIHGGLGGLGRDGRGIQAGQVSRIVARAAFSMPAR